MLGVFAHFRNKLIFFSLGIVVVLAVTLFIVSLIFAPQRPIQPSTISPYLQTTVGKTTDAQIQLLGNIKDKKTLPDGSTQYLRPSVNASLDNIIITKNGTVAFEKAITVNTLYEHPKISDYIATFGKPEAELEGSQTYGKFEKTYVYTSKGFAVVANPFTEEVDEIQTFAPMSVEAYLSTWGTDIKPEQENPEELVR